MTNRLREIRKSQGLTLEQLAERLDTTAMTLQRFETGVRNVSLRWLEKIAKATNVEVSDLVSPQKVSNQEKIKSSATALTIACMAAISAIEKQKKIPNKEKLIEKSIRYFWEDFTQDKKPDTDQIKKYILSLLD